MVSFSKKYLKETLFQAKKHGLSPKYIKELEAIYDEQIQITK